VSDRALMDLARCAGLSPVWVDAYGQKRTVAPDTLRAVLKALGHDADSRAQITDSLGAWKAARARRFSAEQLPPIRACSMKGLSGRKMWGTAAQIYALREGTASDLGDFAALAELTAEAAACGADAVAISPVHALFGARPSHVSPYSPSTRQFLNPLYIPVPHGRIRQGQDKLIDWPRVHARRMRALKDAFRAFGGDRRFDAFVRDGGERLLGHARFEVLDKRFVTRGIFSWRNWPPAWRDAGSANVRALDVANADVKFQLFLQWQAALALADAQARAKSAGMKIGLIADMAVGVDPDGSQAWSRPSEMLEGLTVGAPPDPFARAGQDWGLTTFSPTALRASRFEGFIAMLRAAMRYAGGIRIDHAMGLRRLWVIPRGHGAENGVYLAYPAGHMMNLIARESAVNNCVVIAEDLGTVPRGFRREIAQHTFYGMRVLWFERNGKGRFLSPAMWGTTAAALSTTHDLPTIAGWWTGRDIVWRRKIGMTRADAQRETRARAGDRRKLWQAVKDAHCAKGAAPRAPMRVIDGLLSFLGKTPCPLVIVPAEDLLGLREQPNLPGTTDEHPNWRRRLPPIFANRNAKVRAALLSKSRRP
jgi:4-alpha-glucanotransferase